MSVSSPRKYSLGRIGDPISFDLTTSIDEPRYRAIDRGLRAISRLDTPFTFKLVERNILDLESLHQFVSIILSLGRAFGSPDQKQLIEAIMTSTVNWLTSARLFLDHSETDLKQRFGKGASQVKTYKAACADAFDNYLGYRFCYKFRNYVQHCGLPVSRVIMTEPKGAETMVNQDVSVLLDPHQLLSAYGEWGPVKKDLQAMGGAFSLLPLAEEAMDGLRGVYRVTLEIALDEAMLEVPQLVAAIEELDEKGGLGRPAVFQYVGGASGPMEITPRPLPVEAVRQLKSVLDGKAPRDSLWKPPEPRRRHFDPKHVGQEFHSDRRGVQVITTWLAEGGFTARTAAVVNEIIREDNGIQQLVVGLCKTSTLLALMTARSLGASPEGLIAGLLDLYGRFPESNMSPEDQELGGEDGPR